MLSDPNISGARGGYTEGARAYHDDDQLVTSGVTLAVLLNQERYDTDDIHDLVTNNSRLTCKTAGIYVITGTGIWEAHVDGRRFLMIYLNGSTHIASNSLAPSNFLDAEVHMVVTTIWNMSVNDYVEMRAYQDSGDNIDIKVSAKRSPEFMMQRIG